MGPWAPETGGRKQVDAQMCNPRRQTTLVILEPFVLKQRILLLQ